VRVPCQRGSIGGSEGFVFTYSQDNRTSSTRHNNLLPVGCVQHRQPECALDLQERLADGRLQVPLVKALNQVGQNLRIGLRAEGVPRGREPLFEQQVILNDAVVRQVDLARAIDV